MWCLQISAQAEFYFLRIAIPAELRALVKKKEAEQILLMLPTGEGL